MAEKKQIAAGKTTVKEVVDALTVEIEDLPPVFTKCCIYRVPEKYRRANAEAYTPQVISIGPFHHGKIELQPTEEIKLRYLKSFLRHTEADLIACTRTVSKSEDRIRYCYQEYPTQRSAKFIKMILLDAVFVVELFIRSHYPEHRDGHDEIFSKQWMSNGVFHDVLLLENQVPFFVLKDLYDLTALKTTITFFDLSYQYFKDILPRNNRKTTTIQVLHLMHYVQALHGPMSWPLILSKQTKKTPRAKELQEAGIQFRQHEGTSSILDVVFEDGTLMIPHLVVHEWTEVSFRNMIAYEQCHHDHKYFSSYAILMDSLIQTPKDVNILIRSGVLENQLGNADNVVSLINDMHKEIMRDPSEFLYSNLCESLNAYSRTRWRQRMAILNRDYFSKPWSRLSAVTAGMLLVLTIVQTMCSLMDVYAGDAGRLLRWRK